MIEKIVYLLLIITPIIDTINGFFISKNLNIQFSLLSKGIMIVLVCIYLLLKRNINILIISVVFIFIMFLKFIVQDDNLIVEFNWMIKILFFFLLLAFLKNNVSNNYKKIQLYFYVLLFVMLFNIFGSLFFGFGFSTYDGSGLGTTGFYYAANELGIVIVILAFFWSIYIIHKKSVFKYTMFLVLFLTLSGVTVLKSPILGSVIIFLMVPFLYAYANTYKFKVNKWIFNFLFIFIILITLLLPFVFTFIYDDIGLRNRFEYSLENNHSLFSALLSHRDVWASEMINYFMENINIYNLFFGHSNEIALNNFGNRSEIDLVDIFFSYGLIGTILIYGFWIKFIFTCYKLNTPLSIYIFFISVLVFTISFISGHIINSGIGVVSYAMLFSLVYLNYNPFLIKDRT